MKKIAALFAIALIILVAVLLGRTLLLKSHQVDVTPAGDMGIDANVAAQHLAQAIAFETVSYGVPSPLSKDAFLKFHAFLETTYPNAHRTLQREIINDFSLLYTWPGADPSLGPLVLLGHFDVVPVAPDTMDDWTHPPFEGRIVDESVWGRGTVDDKINVIGTLEAVEHLLAQGYQPQRTILFAFGHDEEAGGTEGAKAIAGLLMDRGVQPVCVIDEGGFIISGVMPGIKSPVALVGIAEKGYVTFRLTVKEEGGHSSTPPKHSAIGILAAALENLEANPFPQQIDGIPRQMLEILAPEMSFPLNMVMGNFWVTKPIVARVMAGNPKTDATLRTTTAITTIAGGVKENVLPTEATATVNFRIYPGETTETTKIRIAEVIDDARVVIEMVDSGASDPSPISPVDSDAYRTIEKTVREIAPDAVVAPYLVLGATDARYFYTLTDNVYRIVPVRLTADEVSMVHGTNERIAVKSVGDIVRYYVQLIKNFNE